MLKRVLLIDDEDEILSILKETLNNMGLQVFEASNGAQALVLMEQHSFDLIVSDYNMPELDGLELLKKLRERNSFVPVIWLTGRADQKIFREAWMWGVYDFFAKPFRLEDFEQSVLAALSFGKEFNQQRTSLLSPEGALVQVPVILPEKQLAELQARADARGWALSSILKEALENYLRESLPLSEGNRTRK